MPKALKKD